MTAYTYTPQNNYIRNELKKKWSITSYPMFFINNIYIGDYNTINKMNIFDEFNEILIDNDVDFSYCEEVF